MLFIQMEVFFHKESAITRSLSFGFEHFYTYLAHNEHRTDG